MFLDPLFDRLIRIFTSLRLTVVCLALALVVVFWGTLAQVDLGLYKAQNEFFRSFLIYWGPKGAGWKIPVFPGGYLIGGVLLINLVAIAVPALCLLRQQGRPLDGSCGADPAAAGPTAYRPALPRKHPPPAQNEAKNYSETEREAELAVIDTSDPKSDRVVAIPQGILAREKIIRPGDLPVFDSR